MFEFLKKNQFAKEQENMRRKSADAESSVKGASKKDAKDVKELHKKDQAKNDAKKKDVKNEETKPASKNAKDTKLEAGHGIILNPHATEKTAHAGTFDTYAFVVAPGANKIEIKKAFWRMYNIKPVSIQVVNMPAKGMYFRQRAGMKSAWKKAYIRAPKGSVISVYEGV